VYCGLAILKRIEFRSPYRESASSQTAVPMGRRERQSSGFREKLSVGETHGLTPRPPFRAGAAQHRLFHGVHAPCGSYALGSTDRRRPGRNRLGPPPHPNWPGFTPPQWAGFRPPLQAGHWCPPRVNLAREASPLMLLTDAIADNFTCPGARLVNATAQHFQRTLHITQCRHNVARLS
jgi:hypothetical protein